MSTIDHLREIFEDAVGHLTPDPRLTELSLKQGRRLRRRKTRLSIGGAAASIVAIGLAIVAVLSAFGGDGLRVDKSPAAIASGNVNGIAFRVLPGKDSCLKVESDAGNREQATCWSAATANSMQIVELPGLQINVAGVTSKVASVRFSWRNLNGSDTAVVTPNRRFRIHGLAFAVVGSDESLGQATFSLLDEHGDTIVERTATSGTGTCNAFIAGAAPGAGYPTARDALDAFLKSNQSKGYPKTGWEVREQRPDSVMFEAGSASATADKLASDEWFVTQGNLC